MVNEFDKDYDDLLKDIDDKINNPKEGEPEPP